MNRRFATVFAAALAAATLSPAADAARVGVLSNRYFAETAASFASNVSGHTFTGVDVVTTTPTLASLQASYDVLLLFEDGRFPNAPNVGNVVAQFANSGRPVVVGTFYDQDRSDSGASASGWGTFETIDPNTTDGTGTPYSPRTLNASTIVAHPLTAGVTTLTSQQYAGGNQAKPGTTVLAQWTQTNALGQPDPAIAFRITGAACVIHIAIAPNYPVVGPGQFGGDFYRVWKNAFDFGAANCQVQAAGPPEPIPALSDAALALTALAHLVLASRRLARSR
jgi:hypothetical protein